MSQLFAAIAAVSGRVARRLACFPRPVRILAGMLLAVSAVFLPVAAGPAGEAAAATMVAPGACGNVLLAGSAWLGGLGVNVRSNGRFEGEGTDCSGSMSKVGGVIAGEEWQCPELVNRLYLTRGWIKATWLGSAGPALWDNTPKQLSKQPNGSVSYLGPGDVVIINVFKNGSPDGGHALIVNDSSPVTSGTVDLVSQNSGAPGDAAPQVNGKISGGKVTVGGGDKEWTYQTIGVVHAPAAARAAGQARLSSSSAVAEWPNADGRMEVFTVGGNGQLDTAYQTQVNGAWSGWTSLGGDWPQGTPIAVGANADGRIEVFLIGGNGQLDTAYQTQVNGAWSGWTSLGGDWPAGDSIAVGPNADGRLQVFLVAGNGQLDTAYQTQLNGAWSGWQSLAGDWPAGDSIAGGANADGRLEVFLVGANGQLYTAYETAVNSAVWSGWTSFGGDWPAGDSIAEDSDPSGQMEIYLAGMNGQLYTTSQTQVNGAWSGWTSLGGGWPAGDAIAAGGNADGRQEVFLIGENTHLYTAYQTAVNGSAWSGWTSLAGTWPQGDAIAEGANADGRMEVFLTGMNGQLYTAYQTQVNGAWSGWTSLGTA